MKKQMKVHVVAQQKGGVGKTASVYHIAHHAAERGLKTLAVDFDSGNLSSSLEQHMVGMPAIDLFVGPVSVEGLGQCINGIELIHATPELRDLPQMPEDVVVENCLANFQRLATVGYDLCIIDTPPTLGVALKAALTVADAVITPLELEAYSIQGVEDMLTTILNARTVNPRLEFLGLVPSRFDARNPRQVQHLQELHDQSADVMTPIVIRLRSAVADALASGIPVWKIRKTTARAAGVEMRALGDYVLDKMGLLA